MPREMLKRVLKVIYLYSGFVQVRDIILKLRHESLITVLAYHRVDNSEDDVNAVSIEMFDKQMAYLKENYRVITVAELLNIMEKRGNRGRAVLITFDDGYKDNFTNAVPILKKYGLPAVFFISSGIVGTDRFFEHDHKRLRYGVPVLSWEDVQEMARDGFEIGSHTVNHMRLSSCADNIVIREIRDSKMDIEKRIGNKVESFSFPFGRAEDFPSFAGQVVRKTGYRLNFSAYGGLNKPTDDPYNIKRQDVPNHSSLLYFKAWVEGWKIRGK